MLSAIKARLKRYCATPYSRGGMNPMWIDTIKFKISVRVITIYHRLE